MDVAQLWTTQGWLYFAGVIGLYSRRVVGWSMSNSPDADLVIDALVMGFHRRRPDEKSSIIQIAARFTPHWPSATGPLSSASPVRSVHSEIVTTMPRSNHSGPRSSVISTGSTAARPGRRGTCCGPRSSTTSRASTTPSASRSASGTVHQPTLNRLPSLRNTCAGNRVNSNTSIR